MPIHSKCNSSRPPTPNSLSLPLPPLPPLKTINLGYLEEPSIYTQIGVNPPGSSSASCETHQQTANWTTIFARKNLNAAKKDKPISLEHGLSRLCPITPQTPSPQFPPHNRCLSPAFRNWVTLLYSRNGRNIENQLYLKKKRRNCIQVEAH